jgi:uncharacterized membrane protein YkoI
MPTDNTLQSSFVVVLLFVCLTGSGFAVASETPDHEQARQAMVRGDVLPLKRVMEHLERQRSGGHILEVELEQDGGRWVYEIKQLEAGGQLVKVKLNAQTGELLEVKQRKR